MRRRSHFACDSSFHAMSFSAYAVQSEDGAPFSPCCTRAFGAYFRSTPFCCETFLYDSSGLAE